MTSLRELLTDGGSAIGVLSTVPDSFVAEVLGTVGFDWVCVDLQHGMVGPDRLVDLLQAFALSGTPVLVRTPWNEPAIIMRVLDSGAAGVIVPMVNSATEARAAVAASRYPPSGIRSWGPTRASLGRPDYSLTSANREVICAVMIETREAMASLDEILAVDGVDAAFVGPSDLAIAHDLPASLQVDDPRTAALVERIQQRCDVHGVVPAIFTSGAAAAARFRATGFRLMTVGSDRLLMVDAAKRLLTDVRQTQG